MVNLKILWVSFGLLVSIALAAACANNLAAEKSATVEYLKAYDQIDNELTDMYNDTMELLAS